MQHRQLDERNHLLVLEPGEEVIAQTTALLESLGAGCGTIQAIGALGEATVGGYDPDKGAYTTTDLEGDYEILSLLGNISILDGERFPHLHVVLNDLSFQVTGGHLFRGVVSATAEIYIQVLPGQVERRRPEGKAFATLRLDS